MIYNPQFTSATKTYVGISSVATTEGHLVVYFADGTVQDLGPATAYAIAKSLGYNGTEEEWASEQINIALNAQEVKQARDENEKIMNAFIDYINAANQLRTDIDKDLSDIKQNALDAKSYAESAESSMQTIQSSADDIALCKTNIDTILKALKFYFGGASPAGTRLVQKQITDSVVAELWEEAI